MLPVVLALALTAAAPGRPGGTVAPPVKAALPTVVPAFAYDLSAPDGVVRLTWPAIAYDRAHQELFVVAEGFVRIFDAGGMEVYRFGDDGSLGYISRVAPLEEGEIVVMTTVDGKREYVRCDFRGEPLEKFQLVNLPEGFEDFTPDQMVYRQGRLYFAERGTMRVVATDVMGEYRQSWSLRDVVADAVKGDLERKPAGSMDGFNVDDAGNIYFTMSTMFAAGVFGTNGELRIFGGRGSTPGKFNIIGGIDSDESGTIFITDRLRSVVSVWTRDLQNLGEFGYRGGDPMNLLTPFELQVGNGKVFVTQAGKKGVKAYTVQLVEPKKANPEDAPPPPPPPEERPRLRPRVPIPGLPQPEAVG